MKRLDSWQRLRDALAVAIGTSHGAYKFTRKPERCEVLAMDRIEAIHKKLPKHSLGDAR